MSDLFEKRVKIAYIREKTEDFSKMVDEKTLILPQMRVRRLILRQAGFNNQPPGWKRPLVRHSHNFWSMDFCSGGIGKVELEKRLCNVKRGDIMLIAPGKEHRFIYGREPFSCYSFKMDIPGLENLPGSSIYIGEPEGLNARLGMLEAVRSCLYGFCPEKLLSMNLPFSISRSFAGIRILEELLYGIACYYILGEDSHGGKHEEDTLLKKISEFIYLHNGKPVTVEEVAEHLGCSAGHLRTLVRNLTGRSTKNFIDQERVKIMKDLLLYSDVRIGELAQLMDFRDTKYFTRFFHKYTGDVPRDWLKNNTR